MGNSNTRESRPGDAGHRGHRPSVAPSFDPSLAPQQSDRPGSRARNRVSRGDLGGLLGIGGSTASGSASASQPDPPYERRETKQEREARRLERERLARIKERERSIKEEHVDGGYLVTLGTYTGPEDFNKQVVRQLQIERKIAPFWRGLNDVDESWAEHQIIAAARGLPIPAADETPPDDLIPRPLSSPDSPAASTQNLNNLTVPLGGRTLSAASDRSASNPGSNLPSPTSTAPGRTSSPFKPRAKALAAALTGGSRNASSTDIAPREINLPNDPFVNGQPLEVYLYKNASECPICFLYYPPYLNHTRCCDQPICSECFVQIKRPDPHYPEGHGDPDNPSANPEETAGQLISEPAQCPYCQQPEFGVTYEAPPFRRGLTYSISTSALGAMNTAMSSSSSLNSNLSPGSAGASPPALAPTTGSRRRTQSLSANAPNVITTDRVRPDWATKLAAQRAHQARRAAAATALHTAAFLMGGSSESRTFRVGRFSRRNTSGAASASANTADSPTGNANDSGTGTPSGPEPGPRSSSGRSLLIGPGGERRRSHMEDLENMMFMEAIRLSLAAEEERKRKAEKEERKEAKKREKEERKAAKAAAKHSSSSGGPYNPTGGSGHSSASGSTLSLPGLGAIGRRRGNSAASNLRMEASVANAMASTGASGSSSPGGASSPPDKGKGVDRGPTQTAPETDVGATNVDSLHPTNVATSSPTPAATASPRPIPSPHQPAGPSHLRQMSSASSVSSSLPDSQAGSYQNPSHLQDPRASGLSLGSQASEDGEHVRGQEHDRDPSASTEPMFNFRSLAEMVGVEIEGEHAGRRLSQIGNLSGSRPKDGDASNSPNDGADKSDEASAAAHEHVEHAEEDLDKSFSTLKPETATGGDERASNGQISHLGANGGATIGEASQEKHANLSSLAPPTVMVTPETPAPDDNGSESKQLGFDEAQAHGGQVTQ